jgi:HEAT repeat protein
MRTLPRSLLAIAATVAVATGARAELQPLAVSASPEVIAALTGIDFPVVKSEMDHQKAALDGLFGADAVTSLSTLADAQNEVSPGVRIRAVRALALYPGPATRALLIGYIHDKSSASAGIEVLELRAAVEALGVIGQAEDVVELVPLLEKEDSRDVRAAAARALRDIGSASAIAPLRARLSKETVPQVQFAISDALRVLSGASP